MDTERSEEQKSPSTQPLHQLVDFTESVLYRPKMYTINGTLEEVGAFLEGYYSGVAKCTHHSGAWQESSRWVEFCHWLGAKIGGVQAPSWYNVFKALRESYSNDAEAFEKLRAWYPEFLKSRGAG
jgi:hypothetical protein